MKELEQIAKVLGMYNQDIQGDTVPSLGEICAEIGRMQSKLEHYRKKEGHDYNITTTLNPPTYMDNIGRY